MKARPAVGVRLAQHALDLDLEAVVLRRLWCCVDLEILRDRLNVRPKRLDKGAVRRLRRKHDPRKQHHPKGRQARDLCHIQTRRARPREILGRTNCLLRRFHVGCNLPYELVLARERSFVPQSLPQLQAQILAVEVALVVEEECLDAALGATVMRVHTDGGGGAAPQGGACVDPMRRHEQAWLHGDVGSREAERAPALVPGHHDPFYFGRPAEEAAAPTTSPALRSSRTRLDDTPSTWGTTCTSSPSRRRSSKSPRRACPKRKLSAATTTRVPRGSSTARTNSSGSRRESSGVNSSTSNSSGPMSPISSMRRGSVQTSSTS